MLGKKNPAWLYAKPDFGAGDGTRTRDNLLGRQTLYQTELLPHDYPTKIIRPWPPTVKQNCILKAAGGGLVSRSNCDSQLAASSAPSRHISWLGWS